MNKDDSKPNIMRQDTKKLELCKNDELRYA